MVLNQPRRCDACAGNIDANSTFWAHRGRVLCTRCVPETSSATYRTASEYADALRIVPGSIGGVFEPAKPHRIVVLGALALAVTVSVSFPLAHGGWISIDLRPAVWLVNAISVGLFTLASTLWMRRWPPRRPRGHALVYLVSSIFLLPVLFSGYVAIGMRAAYGP
jgi:hypothetical protein